MVDLEDMTSGISITDLGLNDFRWIFWPKAERAPGHRPYSLGIHAVTKGEKPGVIFVLKNVNAEINIKNQNRLHPFYMVYVGNDGEIITNHLHPKETLDEMRHIAKGKSTPDSNCVICSTKKRRRPEYGEISKLLGRCHQFNDRDQRGRRYLELLFCRRDDLPVWRFLRSGRF